MTNGVDSVSAREKTPFGNFQLRRSHLQTGGNPYRPGTSDHDRFEAARYFPETMPSSRPAEVLPPEELRRVRLAVATHAVDREDLRLLLNALGLDGEAVS